MKLRRKSTASRARRRLGSDLSSVSPRQAYRSRRSGEELNLSHQPRQPGQPEPDSTPQASAGRSLFRRFGLIVLLIVLVVAVADLLTLSSNAKLVLLSDTGPTSTYLHSNAEYQAAADRLLGSSVWNRNKITVNTGAVGRQMLQEFPELSSASVNLPLAGKHPTVYIQAAGQALILTATNGSFVIDTSGKALLRAENIPAATRQKLPQVTDQSDLTVHLNSQALTSGDVAFIQTVAAQLAARHLSITSAVLPVGTRELDVHVNGQLYTIKFNLEGGDARQQTGTFLATQAKLQSQHITPSQYIDVRVDGRAYYQ